ncbi:MAG: type IX secretion system membrane protein PorP/SprF [Bacteroidota bacterium]|nr:type IX secretion system membrane protein PorP/SprF [Bacteroidota bacterium]
MRDQIIGLILVLLFVVGWGDCAKAQDPQFSQFYANPLYLNPAFAGTGNCPRINMNYRNQWPGITGTFVTHSASYDQHVDALSGGIGLIVTNDKAGEGTLNTTNVSAIYSYQLPVTRTLSIKAGFQGTYLQKRIDWSKLTWGDEIDPRRGFIYQTNQVPIDQGINALDFSAGLLAFSKTYYFGMAVHHINEPNESLVVGPSPLPKKFTFHGGVVIPAGGRSEDANISPNILYMVQQNFHQLFLGLYATKGPMVGGIWYRHTRTNPDAMIVLLGVEQGVFKFGYSYDVTVSKLGVKTWGAHELSLGLQFYCKPKKKKFRTISCPSF